MNQWYSVIRQWRNIIRQWRNMIRQWRNMKRQWWNMMNQWWTNGEQVLKWKHSHVIMMKPDLGGDIISAETFHCRLVCHCQIPSLWNGTNSLGAPVWFVCMKKLRNKWPKSFKLVCDFWNVAIVGWPEKVRFRKIHPTNCESFSLLTGRIVNSRWTPFVLEQSPLVGPFRMSNTRVTFFYRRRMHHGGRTGGISHQLHSVRLT